MLYSIKGKVSFVDRRFIVVETGGIGYEVLVANPESYVVGEETFLFLHHEIKEFDEYLAGFRYQEEKDAFDLLLHVNGVGPKLALTILSNVKYQDLMVAISNADLEFITNIPGIGPRAANQILLDLQGFIARSNRENVKQYSEVKAALKALKFKVKDIDRVLPQIYIPNGTNEEIIKEALKRLHYAETFGQK